MTEISYPSTTPNSFVFNETPSGSVNSSNTVFTCAGSYIGGSPTVVLNGLVQRITTDYTETSPSAGTFTMTTAPTTGDSIRVSYQKQVNSSSLNADTVDGIHASATATANMLMALDSNAKFSTALLTNPYKFDAYRNAALNTAAATNTKLAYDAEAFDTGSNYDSATNYRFTAPVAGFYQFNANLMLGATTVRLNLMFYKNGAEHVRGADIATTVLGVNISALIQLAATDYVEVWYFADAAKAVTTGITRFSGFLVSAT